MNILDVDLLLIHIVMALGIEMKKNIEKYIQKMNEHNSAIVEKRKNSFKDDMEEFMFMGLRKSSGISKSKFKQRFHKDMDSVYRDVINKYTSTGFMKESVNSIFLTYEGIEVSNVIMADFIL